MDNPFSQQRSGTQQPGRLTGLQILDGILNWLAGFFQWTEEEQEDAGIYLGNQHY